MMPGSCYDHGKFKGLSMFSQCRCCHNCGAPLNLELSHCEYCLSSINKWYDANTQTTRYEWGWVDAREIYGTAVLHPGNACRVT